MDIRINCPICGQTGVDSLPEHLQSHSKQALIDILLVQHRQIRSQHSTSHSTVQIISTRRGSSPIRAEGLSESNQILVELQSTSTGTNEDNRSAATVIGIKKEVSTTHHRSAKSALSKTDGITGPGSSRDTSENHKITSNHGKPTFVLVDHGTPTKPGPSRRRVSDDVTSAKSVDTSGIPPSTSIIQYIIDESGQITDAPQEEPDSWILADGRSIPVYSSLTQVPAVSEPVASCTMTMDISNKPSEGETIPITVERNPTHSQMHLDLMTDEEIPPRGEISEYEESNASSILSEDSNLMRANTSGMFSESRRSPATVIHEQNMLFNRKLKKSAKTVPPQHYTCHECPQVQVFSSLFELAEHKFEVHQGKSATSTTTVSITPSDEHILQDVKHILPEKIRRQSQNEELQIPGQDPLAEFVHPPAVPTTSSVLMSRKEYFCVYCNFTASKKTLLAQHMELEHAGKPRVPNVFECTHCGKVFSGRTNLRKHLLVHKDRKYGCPTCSKGFTSNFKLAEHMRVHTKLYPFKCTVCDKTYRTPSLLNYHMKSVHVPEEERPPKRKLEFYCSVCHRILHSKRSYMSHIQLHHEKPMKCSFCSETFTRHSVLVRHIRIAHDPQYESKESKDCPICQKKLHPNSMIKHMRIHSNEKPYSCNVCGKYFRTYANLTSHSWSHTNVEKPHKCKQCSKSYLFKKNLENHMMVHKKKRMHFVCNECGVKFTHKVNMKRHLEEHFKDKNYVCKVCGKAFQRNYYLIEHERIHSGVKPFTCSICGKASTTKSNHRAHLKIHDARETGNQEG